MNAFIKIQTGFSILLAQSLKIDADALVFGLKDTANNVLVDSSGNTITKQ